MELVVNLNGLKSCSDDLEGLYKQLSNTKFALDRCKWELNYYMLSSSYWQIKSNLDNLSKSIQNQINHIKKMSTELNKITDLYSKTELSILDIEKTQAEIDAKERQARENLANIVKFAVFVACVAASVAAIAFSAGAATPFIMGAVGAATGVIKTSSNMILDEYVEKGNLDGINDKEFKDKYTKEVLIAGATGFISGFVGGSITKGLEGASFAKSALESSRFLTRASTKAGINAISEVVVGFGNRGLTNTVDVMWGSDLQTNYKTLGSLGLYCVGGVTGIYPLQGIALKDENTSKIIKNTFDVKEVGKDALSGVISGSVDEVVDSATVIKNFDSKYLNSDNALKRSSSALIVEGGKSVISGIGEDYERALIDGESIGDATKKAFDPVHMGENFIEDGATGAIKQWHHKSVGEAILTEKKLSSTDIASKMPDYDKAESFIKDGGSVYIDSAGKITYEKTDKESSNFFVEHKIREYDYCK